MKRHLIKQKYKSGETISHFKTYCGKVRHVATNLLTTEDIEKVTCKICKQSSE